MDKAIIEKIKRDGVGVIPTDTVYGLVGSAFSKKAVERIYGAKGRDAKKPFIVLVDSMDDLERFGAKLDVNVVEFLNEHWPGGISVILPVGGEGLEYLHRGTKSLAFRMPERPDLADLISVCGPLVAPSANPEGKPPATNIEEAKGYFGDSADFYVDGGDIDSEPSTVVRYDGGKFEVVRIGKVKLNNLD